MDRQKLCQQCDQKQSCRELYQQLGDTKGPSVVWKVILAFLLPIVVFIAALLAFENILDGWINAERLQTALAFLFALSVTFVFILAIKAINKKSTRDNCRIDDRRTGLC